jgi:hypothetical protein
VNSFVFKFGKLLGISCSVELSEDFAQLCHVDVPVVHLKNLEVLLIRENVSEFEDHLCDGSHGSAVA